MNSCQNQGYGQYDGRSGQGSYGQYDGASSIGTPNALSVRLARKQAIQELGLVEDYKYPDVLKYQSGNIEYVPAAGAPPGAAERARLITERTRQILAKQHQQEMFNGQGSYGQYNGQGATQTSKLQAGLTPQQLAALKSIKENRASGAANARLDTGILGNYGQNTKYDGQSYGQ